MQSRKLEILIFLLVSTVVILLMALVLIFLIYLYQKKQVQHSQKIIGLKNLYERNLMQINLEIQENTFQHVSREIHDNISLTLTLAKLHLNMLDYLDKNTMANQVDISINLLTDALLGLNNISKSFNSDIITSYGLVKAIENEIYRIKATKLFEVEYITSGDIVYLDSTTELIIFRIVQEAFNNIIKHSGASKAYLKLEYSEFELVIEISDNGKGFDQVGKVIIDNAGKAGLKNMRARTTMINGKMEINSKINQGCLLTFNIPTKNAAN